MAINKRNSTEAADAKLLLNKMNSTAAKVRLGNVLADQKGSVKAKYDFAIQGGAVGTVNLVDDDGNPVTLPDNAIITNSIVDVITQPASASTPTVAVSVATAGDLITATAIASFTGVLQGTPANTVATAIKLSAEKNLTMTVAGTTLTGGKFIVFADYVVSE